MTTNLMFVYPTAITGSFTVPDSAAPGPWDHVVTTVDGGTKTKIGAVKIV